MGKKRKSVATSLDEVDRTMYSTFCSAANSLSQLYTQTMNQQKLTFQAGERNGLEKLYQWILRQQEGGSRVNSADILNYLQAELDYSGEEGPASPRAPPQNQQSQPTIHFPTPAFLASPDSADAANADQGFQTAEQSDQQSKNYVFSNALSSPVRRSLQNYHIAPEGYYCPGPPPPPASGFRNGEPNFGQPQNRDSNDSSMDMHADSPSHDESAY